MARRKEDEEELSFEERYAAFKRRRAEKANAERASQDREAQRRERERRDARYQRQLRNRRQELDEKGNQITEQRRKDRMARYEASKKRQEELEQKRNARRAPGPSYLTGNAPQSTASPYGAMQQAAVKPSQPKYGLSKEEEAELQHLNAELTRYERGGGNMYAPSKASDNYSNILREPDFQKYAGSRNFVNPSYEDISRGAPIADRLGLYLAASEGEKARSADPNMIPGRYERAIRGGVAGAWDEMNEQEIGQYYYLLNKKGQAAADKYLDDMEIELNRRESYRFREESAKDLENATTVERLGMNLATVPANLMGAASSFVDDTVRDLTGQEYNPYTAAHRLSDYSNVIRSEQAQDFNEATNNWESPIIGYTAGDLYQAGMSILDMAAGSQLGSTAYGALMGMGAATNEAQRLYEEGADEDQIKIGSALAGAAEMIFEHYSIDKLINMKNADTIGQVVRNALVQGGIEASEEGFTEIANTLTNAMVMGSESDWNKSLVEHDGNEWEAFKDKLRDIAKAMVSGAISGGVAGGAGSTVNYVGNQQMMTREGRPIIASEGGTQRLQALADDVVSDATPRTQRLIQKQGQRLQKSLDSQSASDNQKARDAGRLFRSTRMAMSEGTQSAMQANLEEQGFDQKTAKRISEAYGMRERGDTISDRQEHFLKKYASDDRVSDAYKSAYAANDTRTRDFVKSIYGEGGSKAEGQLQTDPGATRISHVTDIKDGKMTLELEDGTKVASDEAIYPSEGEAIVYGTVARLPYIQRETANALIDSFYGTDVAAEDFSRGVQEAFHYGQYNFSKEEMDKRGVLIHDLTHEQRDLAWEIGRKATAAKISEKQANRKFRSSTNGYVQFEDGIDESKFTPIQRASVDEMQTLSKAIGAKFVVYESQDGDDSPNGWYEPSTDTIHIDLRAGNDRGGTMLFTASHELTHQMRAKAPEQFHKLASFLMQEYEAQGTNVQRLVAQQIKKAADHDRHIGYDEAYEEVIADSMQTMLADPDVAEKIAKLRKQSRTVWETIRDFFQDLANRVRQVYKGLNPDSEEGKLVAQMSDSLDKIKQLFAEGVAEASKYEPVAKNATTISNSESVDNQASEIISELPVEKKFSMRSPVEKAEDLIALHNFTEDSIRATLKLGAWPSPSIAIVKASEGHSQYGPFSAIFPGSVIDPKKSKKNKVYGSDAWTPTSANARIDYEVNRKAADSFSDKIWDLSRTVAGGEFAGSNVIGSLGIEDYTSNDATEIVRRLSGLEAVMAAYAADKGISIDPVYQQKKFDVAGNEVLQDFIDKVGEQGLAEIIAKMELSGGKLDSINDEIPEVQEILLDHWKRMFRGRLAMESPEVREKRIANKRSKITAVRVYEFIRNAWEYQRNSGSTGDSVDRYATADKLREAVSEDDVKAWLMPQVEPILGEGGVYNGKDPYTRNGRKSFKQLHYPLTAESIVKAMNATANARGEGLWGATAGGLMAVATPEYKSISEIHADESRLKKVDSEEYQSMKERIDSGLSETVNDIFASSKHRSDNSFEERDIIGQFIIEAVQKGRTAESISKFFDSEDYPITNDQAKRIAELAQEAASMPTGYFEAKPQRVVRFDEAAAVVAPDSTSDSLLNAMRESGMNVMTYKSGDEASRLETLNSIEGVRFSNRDSSESRVNELRQQIEELEDEAYFAEGAEGISLNKRLTKMRYDLDKLIAEERKASKKTSIKEIIDNLPKYRRSDLESLAEQVSDGAWDDYEEMSRESLEESLRDILTERMGGMNPIEAQSRKSGFFVRPPDEDKRSNIIRFSDRDNLDEKQQKSYDYNQKQVTVGSNLKTLKGSTIKRSTKYGVGKEIGGEIYAHKSYADEIVPDEILSQARRILEETHPGFEYNAFKYNPKTKTVAFQEAPDFDTAREPVVGDYVSVNTDTGVAKTGHSNYIWHHKWNWVKNDYDGFDVEESWNWSKKWLSTLTEVSDGNGIARWEAQLDRFGLPHDGEDLPRQIKYSDRNLRSAKPVIPSSDNWQRSHELSWFRENGFPLFAPVSEEEKKANEEYYKKLNFAKGQGTQNTSTTTTYEKIFQYVQDHPETFGTPRILDASAGKGEGTRTGKEDYGVDIHDLEPFPNDQYKPEWQYYRDLQDAIENGEEEPFDLVISNAVLNVMAQDNRDDVVAAMDSFLKPGGQMFVNVISKDYTGAKTAKPEIIRNDKGKPVGTVLLQEAIGDGGREVYVWGSNSVQKVWSRNELISYLSDALPGYKIETVSKAWPGSNKYKLSGMMVVATKPDSRFSDRDLHRLEQDNAKLREDVSDLKELLKLQKSVTGGKLVTRSSVESVAKKLKNSVGAKGDTKELADLLQPYYEDIQGGGERSWSEIRDGAMPAAEWLQSHVPSQLSEYAQDILGEIRSHKIWLSDAQKQEAAYYVGGKYGDYRKSLLGDVRLSAKQEGAIDLDSLWSSLAEQYPGKVEYVPDTQQPMALAQLVDSLNEMYDTSDYTFGQLDAQGLAREVYDNFWNVATLHTVADVKQKQIDQLKGKHIERMQKIREEQKERVAALRKESREAVKAVRVADREHMLEREEKLKTQYRQSLDKQQEKYRAQRDKYKARESELKADKREALEKQREKYREREQDIRARDRASKKEALDRQRETTDHRNARAKLQAVVMDTAKWLSYPSKTDIKCPDMLKKPYADFLATIDLSSKRALEGGKPTKSDLRIASTMDSLATVLDRIQAAQNPSAENDANQDGLYGLESGYLDLPKDFVQGIRELSEQIKDAMSGGTVYTINTMPSEDVKKVTQLIRTLNHAIKEVSRLYANGRFQSAIQSGENSMNFMDSLGNAAKTGGVKDFVSWDNGMPFYVFKRFGEGGESIFEEFMDSQDQLAHLAERIFDFQKKTWTEAEAKAWGKDIRTVKLPSGSTLRLSATNAMTIYCLSHRAEGLNHLLGGGVRVIGEKKGESKTTDSRSTLTLEDVQYIVDMVSKNKRQKAVADAIQSFMVKECAEWGNEISMKRFLTRDFTDPNYFPIESNDENLPTKDPSAQQSDLFRLLNISATKPLTKGANNEVIIRDIFDVFVGHASDMAKLNAFGMSILDAMKWLNFRNKKTLTDGRIETEGTRKSMEQAYGGAAFRYVLNLIRDINGRPSDGGDPALLMRFMRAAKTAGVGGSSRVAFLQMTSYPRAMHVLSPVSLAAGFRKAPNIKDAKKYCGIALWKSFGFYDTNIARSIEDQMKGTTNYREKFVELSLKGAEWGDTLTWGFLWNACETEVARTQKLRPGSEEFKKAVGLKLREVVYSTQVVDSVLTRSQIMRSKKGMAQEASAFMSEPTLSANILMNDNFQFEAEKRRTGSLQKAWMKTGKRITRDIAIYLACQSLAASVEALFDAWRDEDDDKFGEKYAPQFWENLLLDIMPLNKLPVISDAVEALLSTLGIGFYSSDKLSTTFLTQGVQAVKAWKSALSGNSSTTIYNALYKSLRSASSATGLPMSGLMREAVDLWNNTIGRIDLSKKILKYERRTSETADRVLDAILSGDTDREENLRSTIEDEQKFENALKNAIRDRFKEGQINSATAMDLLEDELNMSPDDAYWKIDEWEHNTENPDEDYSKYGDFFAAVETGKGLRATINEYTKNGVDSEKLLGQLNSHYKETYIGSSAGERSRLRGYLANAMEMLGEDREEAVAKLAYWDFQAANPGTELSASQVERYTSSIKPAGISLSTYTDYLTRKADYTKKAEIMAVIDSLPISSKQKDALYNAEGYASSTIWQAPWH